MSLKAFFKPLSLIIAALSLSANTIFVQASDDLVIYSSRTVNLIQPLIDGFKKHHKVNVKLMTGKDEALIERLKMEGRNSPADLLMTVDAGNLGLAAEKGLFQPMNIGPTDVTVPAHLQDNNGLWTGLSLRARTIIYNPKQVDSNNLTTYEDLANPIWKGKLCLRTSKKVYNKSLAASFVANYGVEKTQEIFKGWVNNLATKPFAKDSEVIKAVNSGQCAVGIVNTYYVYRHQAKNPQSIAKLFWANQATTGTHINISGAGITKNAKNVANARLFLAYLLSHEAQKIFADLNHEFSIAQLLSEKGKLPFKADNLPMTKLHTEQLKGVKLMQIAGYE